ncbi:E3 SUMO-protein ligase KIAA1586-like isoform X2 [Varroa jacobsoni]|uniref:E3 SUMO-protein ligase KIAA1586-like isoform X2 n=1 Tax=Varroa jacobsoni TaxID=62625 RepID=UPI000BF4781E|nr:E3 SUMO-protein ligase KIAA1586-like isoform X2 [Varroa jacobsoni]
MKRAYPGATESGADCEQVLPVNVVGNNCGGGGSASVAAAIVAGRPSHTVALTAGNTNLVVVSTSGTNLVHTTDVGIHSGNEQQSIKVAKLAKASTEPESTGELAGLDQLELTVTETGTGEDVGGAEQAEEVLLVEAIQSGGDLIAVPAGTVVDDTGATVAGVLGDVTATVTTAASETVATETVVVQVAAPHSIVNNTNEDGVTYETVQGSVGLSNDTVTAVEWPGERSGETEVPVGGDEDEALSGGTSIMDDEWLEEGDGTWPPIWTREMWLERRAKHHWLSARESRLGCRYCLRVKYMGTSAGDSIDVSSEWVSYSIAYSGETREQQLKSLRNKIQRHEVSKAHVKAEELINNNKNNLPTHSQVTQTLNKQVHMTAQVFKDVYALVKESIDFEVYEATFQANLKYKSYRDFAIYQEFEAVSIVWHIAEQIRSQLVRQVMSHRFPLAVVVDHVEGYLTSAQSVFLIYLRIRSESSGLRNVFWDAIPYPSTNDPSMGPMPVVSQSLLDGGFTVDFLSQHLMCFVTDPLGVHLGAGSNLCHQLALSFDKIVIWYVLAYRLEEMVLATMRKLAAPNYIGQLYETLFALTQLSDRNLQELLINTPSVHDQVLRVGQLFQPADVASTFKAVSALSESYAILYMYMIQAGNDTTRSEAEKRKYSFAKGLMESEQFVRELALVYDVLKLLHDTRMQVDCTDCDMARADSVLVQAMEGLMTLRQQPGPFETAALTELQPGGSRMFINVGPLIDNPLLQAPNRAAFMDHIVELSRENMISISGLAEHLVENFIRDLHTINLTNWPPNAPVTFADESVRRLCSVFELEDREADIREAFRNFVRTGRQAGAISQDMVLLQNHANVFPCSSEMCADVVEKINKCKPARAVESIRSLSASLFVHVNGDSIFVPLPLVRTWCVKYPLATESKTPKKKKPLEEENCGVTSARTANEISQGQQQSEESFVAVLQE